MSDYGSIEDSMGYPVFFNWVLNFFVIGTWFGCVYYGSWGLFIYNDGGELMNECFNVGLKGGMAEFLEA